MPGKSIWNTGSADVHGIGPFTDNYGILWNDLVHLKCQYIKENKKNYHVHKTFKSEPWIKLKFIFFFLSTIKKNEV